jgi:hypothetical protein
MPNTTLNFNTQIKSVLITAIALFSFFNVHAQIAHQGFESNAQDTWNYNSNITPYNLTNPGSSNDVWDIVSGQLIGASQNAIVTAASTGTYYFGVADIDNSHALGILGGIDPIHMLTFDPILISNVSVDLTFDLFFVGYDTADYIFLEIAYDNGTDWSSPDALIEIDPATSGSNLASNDGAGTWETFTHVVPEGHSHVRMRFIFNQNGNNDFAGIDNINLDTHSLSNSSIEEQITFKLFPNPITNKLYFSANSQVKTISIYNILGQHVTQQSFDTTAGYISTEHLISGIYIAKVITTDGLNKSVKFIKK